MKKLDRETAKHILDRLEWLSANLDSTKLFPLKGALAGLYKFREGSYRIIFEIRRTDRTIIVHKVGHRSALLSGLVLGLYWSEDSVRLLASVVFA